MRRPPPRPPAAPATGAARTGRSAWARPDPTARPTAAQPAAAPRTGTPAIDELVLGVAVLLREAVGLPLRRAAFAAGGERGRRAAGERQRLAHPAVVEVDQHFELRERAPRRHRRDPRHGRRGRGRRRRAPIVADEYASPVAHSASSRTHAPIRWRGLTFEYVIVPSTSPRTPGTVPVSRRPATSTLTSTDAPRPRSAPAPAARSRRPPRSRSTTGRPSCPGGSLPAAISARIAARPSVAAITASSSRCPRPSAPARRARPAARRRPRRSSRRR